MTPGTALSVAPGSCDAGRLVAAGRLDLSPDGAVATIGRLIVVTD